MNIPATELKQVLKRLSALKTEAYILSDTIQAQDSDALVVAESHLKFDEPFAVNGKKLTQVVNRMSGQVGLVREPNKLVVRSGRAKVELEIQKAKPAAIPEPPKHTMTLPLGEFKSALSVAGHSVDPARSAKHGNSVHLFSLPLPLDQDSPTGYVAEGAGLGARILTRVRVDRQVPREFNFALNLAAAGVVQLMDGDVVEVGETNNAVHLSANGVRIYATRPPYPYPDFTKAFPPKFPTIFQIETEGFTKALHTVEPMLDETQQIACKFHENIVQLQVISQTSTAEDSTEYEQVEPDPVFEPREMTLNLNAKHLSGFLGKAGEKFRVCVFSPTLPVKLESGNLTVLTMPVK